MRVSVVARAFVFFFPRPFFQLLSLWLAECGCVAMGRVDRDITSLDRAMAREARREKRRGDAPASRGDRVLTAAFTGLLAVASLVGAVFLFVDGREDLVCAGITRINRGGAAGFLTRGPRTASGQV